MYVKLNARNQIVEATDDAQNGEYTEIAGTVAENMPNGLLGFNGTVNTPNYAIVDGTVTARTEEDKALDPYSDTDASLEQRVTYCEEDIDQILTGLEGIT